MSSTETPNGMQPGKQNLKDPFLALSEQLSPGDSILVLDWSKPLELDLFYRRSIKVQILQHAEKDFRFLTLPKARFKAALWEDGSLHYRLEEVQRVLQVIFNGLETDASLYFGFSDWQKNTHKPDALHSLLRQCGFSFEGSFESTQRAPSANTLTSRVLWSFRKITSV
jgi:hypothetical protein